MTINDAKKLRSGDQVKWTDPDGGICSKILTISEIIIPEDSSDEDSVISITDVDGSHLLCFASELS